jgi:hypothetical protein
VIDGNTKYACTVLGMVMNDLLLDDIMTGKDTIE